MTKTAAIADIYYMDEGRETIRQCYNNTLHGYLDLAKEMAKTHEITKVFISEQIYTTPEGTDTVTYGYWYEWRDGELTLTNHKYRI